MKKILSLLCLALAGFSQAFAQLPIDLCQKSATTTLREEGITLPAGFTYANRDNATVGYTLGAGIGEAGLNIAAAIELPAADGLIIKGITYLSETKEEYGKVFVATRLYSDIYGNYTLEQVKTLKSKTGLNTITFDKPITTESGKVYAVGYEVKSSGNKGDGSLYPVGFIMDDNMIPESNMVVIGKKGTSTVGKVGTDIAFSNLSEKKFGNLAIVVDLDDSKKKLDLLASFANNIDLPAAYKIGNSIPVSETKYLLPIINLGYKAITKVSLSVKTPDGSTDKKEYPVNIARLKSSTITYEGGEITKQGRGTIEFTIKGVNDGANNCSDPNKFTAVASYALFPQGQAVLRNKFLLERFTTEKDWMTPMVDERLETVYKEAAKKGLHAIVATHHVGFESDFLTLEESKELLPFFTSPYKRSFTPAFVISRLSDKKLRDEDPGQFKGMYMMPAMPESILKQFDRVHNIPTEATISKVVQEGKETRSIIVTGKVLAPEAKDDIYLSIYRTESGIPQKNQEEAPAGYQHNNTIQEFVTPTFGQKVTVGENGEFTIKIENVKVDRKWDNNKVHFVIFIHRNIKNKELWMRYVYAAESIGVHTMTSTREVSPEIQPVAYAVDGRILINGAFDSFVVYDVSGRIVSISSDTILPAGLYIVKSRLGDLDYISKVLVN